MSGDPEADVAFTLRDAGVIVAEAGERHVAHDLSVLDHLSGARAKPFVGDYEVKSLWRRSETSAFDRRFKVGKRGETIYGRRDAALKAFVLALEDELESIMDFYVRWNSRPIEPSLSLRLFDEVIGDVDAVLARRHSKERVGRLVESARSSLSIPRLAKPATDLLDSTVTGRDILGGYHDLKGIFLVAGDLYTLITIGEIPYLLEFDSASSEGAKLRYTGSIPSEIRKNRNSGKK